MKIIQLKNYNLQLLDQAAFLFNEYRKFYQQDSNIGKAREFLLERIKNNESEIFLALDNEVVVGFMQLYRSFSSVGLKKIFILNDLYIDEKARGKGVGRLLINEAKNFAIKNGVGKITLSTSKTNEIAQNLYESEGYVRDEGYFVYDFNF